LQGNLLFSNLILGSVFSDYVVFMAISVFIFSSAIMVQIAPTILHICARVNFDKGTMTTTQNWHIFNI